jgi:hypothetical protein
MLLILINYLNQYLYLFKFYDNIIKMWFKTINLNLYTF